MLVHIATLPVGRGTYGDVPTCGHLWIPVGTCTSQLARYNTCWAARRRIEEMPWVALPQRF